MAHYLHVELGTNFTLDFKIHNTPIAELWLDRMSNRNPYPLDHPDRFYGFNSREQEISRAVSEISHCVDAINSYKHIITRSFNGINDQDSLNYLHNIFERYHGLLDQQDHEFWNSSPATVRQALANLNLAVHRCEAAARGQRARFVCTWFGMPKQHILDPDLIAQYGQLSPPFGSVCLNYVEIGKTLEDLTQDNDTYITEEAFKPFDHYSADFVARFFEEIGIDDKLQRMKDYYNTHITFFRNKGYTSFEDPRLLPYRLPVAQLQTDLSQDQLLKQIQQQQHITRVYIQ